MIYLPVPMQAILAFCLATLFAVCLAIATQWLLSDDPMNMKKSNMKQYQVYAEIVVTKEVAVVFAESEEEAAEMGKNAASGVAQDLGVSEPEIVWAEEI